MSVQITNKGPVIIPKKEAWSKYGVYYNQFNSRFGLFFLKKSTFDRITDNAAVRADAREYLVRTMKALLGTDGTGKASSAVAERFCQMNDLDIKKAEFYMVSHLSYNNAETFAVFAKQDRIITDIVMLRVELQDFNHKEDFLLLHMSKDNGGHQFAKRIDSRESGITENGMLMPYVKFRLAETIKEQLQSGFVAKHSIFEQGPNERYDSASIRKKQLL